MSWQTHLFESSSKNELEKLGSEYSKTVIPNILRNRALKQIQWHKDNADKIVIVSASLNLYLRPWCEENGFELICSELESKNDIFSGRYVNGDCTGAEKAKRVLEKYQLNDFNKIYVYGDTSEDKELLDLADEKYFRWTLLE